MKHAPARAAGVPVDVTTYATAVSASRFHDAATDVTVHQAWKDHQDPLARALLILAAAHLHDQRGNAAGAKAKLERAIPYLRDVRGDARAPRLIAHAETALAHVDEDRALPPFPVDALDA